MTQVEALARRDARFHAGQDVARAGAKKGHARLLGKLPQRVHIGIAGAAVVQQDRNAQQQAADQQVPHHPAGGGEPEKAIILFHIHADMQALHMFKQNATLPLHNGFGQARRT